MFTTVVESEINADIKKVFTYIRNFESMPSYNSSLKQSVWVDSNQMACKIVLKLSIVEINSEYCISELKENNRIVASCKASALEFEDIYELEARNEKTFLRITDKMQLKGLLYFSEGLLANTFKKEMQENLNRLVKILES
jgi:carbon monoxide dehydrogenase subunit G